MGDGPQDLLAHSSVRDYLSVPKLAVRLQHASALLAECEADLARWLGERRSGFPRFYFLSDEELTALLSEGSKSPRNIFPAVQRLIPGVGRLEFNRKSLTKQDVVCMTNFRSCERLNAPAVSHLEIRPLMWLGCARLLV